MPSPPNPSPVEPGEGSVDVEKSFRIVTFYAAALPVPSERLDRSVTHEGERSDS
jgi:hypothetical protein